MAKMEHRILPQIKNKQNMLETITVGKEVL